MDTANHPLEMTGQDDADVERLADHLMHAHGRLPYEIAGLPLRAIHGLEHFDESLGLLALRHSHTA